MSDTQAPSNAPNDGSHLRMSSQQHHSELELIETNRNSDGNSGSGDGVDSQMNDVMHDQAQYALSNTGDSDVVTESNYHVMHNLQQDLSNMALAAQSNDAMSTIDLRLLEQTTTINHTYNLSQELVDAFDLSDADSDTTITELEQCSTSFTSDDEISMRTSPTRSLDSVEANSEAASNIINAEEDRSNQHYRRHYRYIAQANAITAQLAGTTPRQKREPTADDLRYDEIIAEERRQSRRNRPRSRSVDDYLSSLDNPHTVYPPITKITNSNPDVRREIDFEIRRPLEGTSAHYLEDITAAEIGRIEPHKFTLCRCDYDDPTHVFVHTYPDIVVFDWYNKDDIMDLNLFRISIIAKTFNIDYLKTDTGNALSGDEDMKDG